MTAMVRFSRLVVDLLATILIVPVALPMWFAPRRVAVALGRIGGAIGFLVWGRARRAGMINLRRAYGSALSKAEARRAVLAVFQNMGESIAEGVNFSRVGLEGFGKRCRIEDDGIAEAIRDDPRPKIFVTAHLGSWEVALMTIREVSGLEGSVIARRVDNPFLNAIVRHVRFRSPEEWIEKRGAAEKALERLRAGKSIAMLLDENGGPRGPFVPFFGRPASTRKTAALLAATAGALIVAGVAVRRQDEILLRLATLEPPADASREAVTETTARITAQLEAWIREDHLQWRWIHWRWRQRPDGTEESYGRRDLEACFASDVGSELMETQLEKP